MMVSLPDGAGLKFGRKGIGSGRVKTCFLKKYPMNTGFIASSKCQTCLDFEQHKFGNCEFATFAAQCTRPYSKSDKKVTSAS